MINPHLSVTLLRTSITNYIPKSIVALTKNPSYIDLWVVHIGKVTTPHRVSRMSHPQGILKSWGMQAGDGIFFSILDVRLINQNSILTFGSNYRLHM